MPYPDKLQLAREEMLKAESALKNYFQSPAFDPGQLKPLADAVKTSRDIYVDQLETLFPKR